MAIKITKENYQKYKAIYEIFWNHYSLFLPPDIWNNASPIDFLNKLELKSPSLARRSLQSGIADLVFLAERLPRETLEAIDRDLQAKALPPFEMFKREVSDTPGKVLKRGKIKNLDEYYIIKEYECDMSNDLTEHDRKVLADCLFAFENKSKSAN